MGFYVKDLYVDGRFRRRSLRELLTLHDPLTNPPTVPETTPIISAAHVSPALVELTAAVRDRQDVPFEVVDALAGEVGRIAVSTALLPADDGAPVPSPITPIALHAYTSLSEADLVHVRDSLRSALEATEQLVERLAPSERELAEASRLLAPARG